MYAWIKCLLYVWYGGGGGACEAAHVKIVQRVVLINA